MAGNRLGSRSKYIYTSDSGSTYAVETDDSLAIAGFGAAGAAPVAYDPASPGSTTAAPKRFKPRGVYVQASDGARKFVICFNATASAYARNNSASYTIDTEEGWASTGRRGESQSF